MSDRPWISVVTITRHDEAGLVRTLSSTVDLRATGAEHLVVDGGGDPATVQARLEEYRVAPTYVQQMSRGIAQAFNQGWREASGAWIWFLNGGDAMHELVSVTALRSQLGSSLSDVVVGRLQYDGEPEPRAHLAEHLRWPLLECWLPHPATLVRREVLERLNGFDESFSIAMDFDFWSRLFEHRPRSIEVIDQPLARFDTTGISQRSARRHLLHVEEARILSRNRGRLVWEGAHRPLRLLRRLWQVAQRARRGDSPGHME